MKYTVRNADGELTYESLEQLREAADAGLVAPDDEVKREDEGIWRKASALPKLRSKLTRHFNPMLLWIAVAVLGSIGAFVAIRRGGEQPELYVLGLVLAFAVVGVLFKVTNDTAKRR